MTKIKRLIYVSLEDDLLLIEMFKKGYVSSQEKDTISDLMGQAIRMLYESKKE